MTAIKQATGPALGQPNVKNFPKVQYAKIKEIINAINAFSTTLVTTTLTATTAAITTLTAATAVITGKATIGGVIKKPTGTTVVANTGVTLTAAMILSGYVEVTGTTGSLALDTVANLTSALGTSPAGTSLEFTLNTIGGTPMTAGNVLTITAPASCTFMKQTSNGDTAVAFLATVTATAGVHLATYRVTYDTATTIVVQRIG